MVDKATVDKLTKSPVFLGAAALAAGAGVYALVKGRGGTVQAEQEPAASAGMAAKEAGFGGVLDTSGPEYPGVASQELDAAISSINSAAAGLSAQAAAEGDQPFDARIKTMESKIAAEDKKQTGLAATLARVQKNLKKTKQNLKKNTKADRADEAAEKKHEKKQAKTINKLKDRLDAQEKIIKKKPKNNKPKTKAPKSSTGPAKALSAQVKPKVKRIDTAKLRAETKQMITTPQNILKKTTPAPMPIKKTTPAPRPIKHNAAGAIRQERIKRKAS